MANKANNHQINLIKASVSSNIGVLKEQDFCAANKSFADRIKYLFRIQSLFSLIWLCSFIVIAIVCLICDFHAWLNVIDFFFFLFATFYITKGYILGVYIALIEVLINAFINYKFGIFSETLTCLVIYLPLYIIQIINWNINIKKHSSDDSKQKKQIVIEKMSRKDYIIYISLFVVSLGFSYLFLAKILKQHTSLIFGIIALALQIISQLMIIKRFKESFIIYMLIDLSCIMIWIQSMIESTFSVSALVMVIYSVAGLINDFYGYALWKSMYRKVAVNGGILLAMRKVNIKRIAKLRRRFRNLKWNKEVDVSKNS